MKTGTKLTRRLAAIFGTLAVAALVMLGPLAASAVTDLTYNDDLKDIQQTDNNPCVIGSPSCTSGDVIPFTSVPGGPGDQDLNSPTYTVDQLVDALGSTSLNILIDVNQSCGDAVGCPISLDTLEVLINGVVQFALDPVPQTSPLAGSLSGNGFSDAGVEGLDLSGFNATDTVVFHIVWSDQSDGQESFFLAPTTATPVPEPASLFLLGSGLAGAGIWARKRLMRKSTETKGLVA